MPEILDYRSSQPAAKPSSRGTLARAAMAAVLAAAGVEAIAFGLAALIGRPAWLVLACAIPLFATWFVGVVFAVAALLDRDGPRGLATAALAIALCEAGVLVLVPLVR